MKCLMLVLVALLGGCATQEGEFSWETHTWTKNDRRFALDHVSKQKVEVAKAVHRNYLGETYYFGNELHAQIFDGNPWAYLYTDDARAQAPQYASNQN